VSIEPLMAKVGSGASSSCAKVAKETNSAMVDKIVFLINFIIIVFKLINNVSVSV
jgi:hypothetical protein